MDDQLSAGKTEVLPQLQLFIARPRTMSEFVGHNSLNTGNLDCPKQNLLDGTYDLKCDLLKSCSWNLTEEESPDIFLIQETAINEFIEEQGVLRVYVKKYI